MNEKEEKIDVAKGAVWAAGDFIRFDFDRSKFRRIYAPGIEIAYILSEVILGWDIYEKKDKQLKITVKNINRLPVRIAMEMLIEMLALSHD